MRSAPHHRAGTNRDSLRRHNLSVLLGHLHRDGQLSRAELTARLALGRSTIAGLVSELEALGLLSQLEPSPDRSGVGRPSFDVRPNPGRALALAAQIGEDELRVAAVGLGGTIQARREQPTPRSRRPAAIVAALLGQVRAVLAQLSERAVLLGLAVGVPGMVGADGTVRLAPNLGWSGVALPALLREELPSAFPIHVAHDVNYGALGEYVRGAGVGHEDLVYVGCDVGVGAGIRVGGRALTGAGGYAGELGHLVIHPGGRPCRCGSRGCWETEVNADAVAAALGSRGSDPASLERALAALPEPPEALRAIGRYLGLGLGNIVNTFNPEVIVLGGILREIYPSVRDEADRALRQGALEGPREQVRVVLPGLGGDAVLVGAAERVFEALLADPARVVAEARRWTRELRGAAGGRSRARRPAPA